MTSLHGILLDREYRTEETIMYKIVKVKSMRTEWSCRSYSAENRPRMVSDENKKGKKRERKEQGKVNLYVIGSYGPSWRSIDLNVSDLSIAWTSVSDEPLSSNSPRSQSS